MLNVAVIGIGNISAAHIQAYLMFRQRCRMVVFVDIYPEKAEKRIVSLNLEGIEVFDDHRKILGRSDIDLVSICTPPNTHAEITINCLKAGFHVLVEKPMAPSLEECDAMIQAQAESGNILAVVAQNRFRNPIMSMKATLDSGLAGRILHSQIDSFWWRAHSYYDLWWRGRWSTEGGGCTLNHAVHHIDMLAWMRGMPQSVSAILSNAAHDNSEVEDISVAALLYEDGSMAQVTSSVIHHGEEQQLIFQGEKARISVPWKVAAHRAAPNAFPLAENDTVLENELTEYYESRPALEFEGHAGEIDDVMHAIEDGSQPLIDGLQGRNTIELITAIYKAGAERRTVDLPIGADDPFYTMEGMQSRMPVFYEKRNSKVELEGEISLGSDYGSEK